MKDFSHRPGRGPLAGIDPRRISHSTAQRASKCRGKGTAHVGMRASTQRANCMYILVSDMYKQQTRRLPRVDLDDRPRHRPVYRLLVVLFEFRAPRVRVKQLLLVLLGVRQFIRSGLPWQQARWLAAEVLPWCVWSVMGRVLRCMHRVSGSQGAHGWFALLMRFAAKANVGIQFWS